MISDGRELNVKKTRILYSSAAEKNIFVSSSSFKKMYVTFLYSISSRNISTFQLNQLTIQLEIIASILHLHTEIKSPLSQSRGLPRNPKQGGGWEESRREGAGHTNRS